MKIKIRKTFTLVEILIAVVILLILIGMFMPSLQSARQKAKFTRWYAFNRACSNDPDCVINFNFQEGEGNVLYNSAQGCDFKGFDSVDYNGFLSNVNGGDHNFEWVDGGRWGNYKKALQFNGTDTYIDVPGTAGLNFTPVDSFTICCWVRFDKFTLGDGLFSKSAWGTVDDADAQYDLYCDPSTNTPSGDGAFEVDAFTSCVGWNQSNVQFDIDTGWLHLAYRYRGGYTPYSDGVDCFVNGENLGSSRETNNSIATNPYSTSNCIIGAIGAKEEHWGAPIIFPFQGRIDEFLVYKRALSDSEIAAHYEMGKEY